MKEQALVNQVLHYLTLKGYFVYRNNTGAVALGSGRSQRFMRFGYKGSCDVIGVTPEGLFIGVECKIKPNKPTQFQLDFIEEINKRGGIGLVAYDLDDVVEYLDKR